MCGIWGSIHFDNSRVPTDYPVKLNQLSSRGPDGKGFYSCKNVGLGHTRLAINDLEFGQQPIIHRKEKIAAVVNGEIYNSKFILGKAYTNFSFEPLSISQV